MPKKIFLYLFLLLFAFFFLFLSIARTARIRYSFIFPMSEKEELSKRGEVINYKLPYPGRILPDHPLWPLKVLRDKMWLFVSSSFKRKAELNLLFADKRLVSAKILFEMGKPDLAYSTLTKAEKYLEKAYFAERKAKEKGIKTDDFLEFYALATLKHWEIMKSLIEIVPEDAKPLLVELISKYPKFLYERARDALYEVGKIPPLNPFQD